MLPPPQMLRGTPWDLRDVRENTRRRFSPTSRRSQGVPRSLRGGESEVYMCKKKGLNRATLKRGREDKEVVGRTKRWQRGQRGGREDKEVVGRTKRWQGGQRGGNSAGVPIIIPMIVRLTDQHTATHGHMLETTYMSPLSCTSAYISVTSQPYKA